MTINRVDMGEVTVLRLHGNVVPEGVQDLRRTLTDCFEAGRCNLVLNMVDVSFLCYGGLGVLVEWVRKVRAKDGDIRLSGVTVYIDRLFQMVGITSLFEVFDSEADGVGSFDTDEEGEA